MEKSAVIDHELGRHFSTSRNSRTRRLADARSIRANGEGSVTSKLPRNT